MSSSYMIGQMLGELDKAKAGTKRVFEFTVLDPPTPMGRKRFSGQTATGKHFYAERKDVRSVHHIREAFTSAYPDELPIQARIPVKMSIKLWHRCPKSLSKKQRLLAWMKPVVTTKPDINNVVNQVFDALSGYAYIDDNQITWLGDVMMFYAIDRHGNDTSPRLLITIEEL